MEAIETETTSLIDISDLEAQVRATKSESSARNYLAMLKRLRAYNGNRSVIPVSDITPRYVTGFSDYLFAHQVATSSVRLFIKCLRSVLKDGCGDEHTDTIRHVFKSIDTTTRPLTRDIDIDDVNTIAYSRLSGQIALQKIRDLFMFALYGGGMSLTRLRTSLVETAASTPDALLPQQAEIIRKFTSRTGLDFSRYAANISEANYAEGLYTIGHLLNLRVPLSPISAASGWIAVARHINIPLPVIAATVCDTTLLSGMPYTPASLTKVQRHDTLSAVADAIRQVTPRWHVMRCLSDSPQSIRNLITGQPDIIEGDKLDTFIPTLPVHKGSNGRKSRHILSTTLFFRCSQPNAVTLKKQLAGRAYVYSFRDSGKPAYIPDSDMKMFMFLTNVASDTISEYYPDESEGMPEFKTGDRVTISYGNLSGQVGFICKTSPDKMKVFIRLEALNGAIVTAELPRRFLTPKQQ